MSIKEIIEFILWLIPVLFSAGYSIFIIVKTVIKKKNAGKLTANDIQNAALQIKEIARNAIYDAESQFKTMKQQGIKCGAFKLDSVLKTVDVECLKQGLTYDREDVKQFVTDEVNKMKEVK